MRTEDTATIRLEDYRPSSFLIDTVHLDINLDAVTTVVRSLIALRPNIDGLPGAPLVLDGDELSLVSILLNGVELDKAAYAVTPQSLVLHSPPQKPFTLTIETRVNPTANTKLMGLYRSSGVYCTQCEADGFRRISYFLDRPDVLSVYTVRLEGSKAEAPILLSNGNRLASGEVPGTDRHYAVWHDPWPKPAYLFALVGGDLGVVLDGFTTMGGRKVGLGVYVEKGKEGRAAYAMDAIKRSMVWDEKVFGREYDLDVFNVVAVSDFNMGAMENKGLNIFNDKYVLASPESATDGDYANIEGIIAHEYFHNWTGNRITCRDWFQLCLKEGLTVYRDQEFTADERSRPVKRIADVVRLRLTQFVEDSGPLAHNVRPRAYKEINNFYTATVYEKGAELIRMLKVLIGDDAFGRGMNLYFDQHDGTAATIEEFVACFAEASGTELGHFAQWYDQAGTPVVVAAGQYHPETRTYTLDVAQSTPPTPGQDKKAPLLIPIRLGLVGASGDLPLKSSGDATMAGDVLLLDKPAATVTFHDVNEAPALSLLRGFSAPIRLEAQLGTPELLTLARLDSDPFNRWQALRTVMTHELVAAVASFRQGKQPSFDPALVAAIGAALSGTEEPAYIAQLIGLPSASDIAREIATDVDPDAIRKALVELAGSIGKTLAGELAATHDRLASKKTYSPDAASAGSRALRNTCLTYLCHGPDDGGAQRAFAQFETAGNMTDRLAAMSALTHTRSVQLDAALAAFETRYRNDALVLDKWFALQATMAGRPTLDRVRALLKHEKFSLRTPNRVYALLSSFAHGNPSEFHRPDGAGYDFVADLVVAIDGINPQVASRLLSAFRTWKTLEPSRRILAHTALRRVADMPGLSRDLTDIAERALA
ncbi:MAG: aminopeptidase N [Bosea sp. (in: a-proteobacteria)]